MSKNSDYYYEKTPKNSEYYYEKTKDQQDDYYQDYEDYNSIYHDWPTTKSPPRSLEFNRCIKLHFHNWQVEGQTLQ